MPTMFFSLPQDYKLLTEEILALCGLSPCQMVVVAFHCWSYHPSPNLRSHLAALLCTTR